MARNTGGLKELRSASSDRLQGNKELSPIKVNRMNLEMDFFSQPLESSTQSTPSFSL